MADVHNVHLNYALGLWVAEKIAEIDRHMTFYGSGLSSDEISELVQTQKPLWKLLRVYQTRIELSATADTETKAQYMNGIQRALHP